MNTTAQVKLHGPLYTLTLRPRVVYNWGISLSTYAFGWQYDGRYGYVELCSGCLAVIKPSRGEAFAEVYCAENTRCWEQEIAELESMLGLNEDLTDYHRLALKDPLVGKLVERYPGLHIRRTSIWYGFLIAVCQQNASFKQGWRMLLNIHKLLSRRLVLPQGHVYLETPLPHVMRLDVLKEAKLGYRAKTIMEAIARKVFDLDCSNIDSLKEVKGVGRYTYALVKVLACRDYTVLPLDRWLRRLASEAYGVPENEVEKTILNKFGRWQGLMAIHATIAFDAEVLSRALARLKCGQTLPGLTTPSPINMWQYFKV